MNPAPEEKLPERKVTYRQHPAYMARENAGMTRATIIGREGCFGSRWFHGPMCVERFTGDIEPEVVRDGQWRIVVWQTLARTDRPKGWLRGFPGMSVGLTGYAPMPDDGEYSRRWSPHARRQLAKWRKSGWVIREISYDEYVEGYARSGQDVVLRAMFSSILRSKIRTHPGLVRMYGAAPSADPAARIEAAFASNDVPETSESLHMLSYICPSAFDSGAGVGLMDHWFRTAGGRGVSYFDFGIFWKKGDPRSWKGFSRFKSQFGVRFFRYPTPLMRFTRGK